MAPRQMFKVKLRMKRPRELTREIWKAIAEAASAFSTEIYPLILANIPPDKYDDDRRKKGVIARQLKLVEARLNGLPYTTLGIPGKSVEAIRAKHALLSLHYGWNPQKPIKGKIMAFPVTRIMKAGHGRPAPGGEGPKNWIVTEKIKRKGGYQKNPFLVDTVKTNLDILRDLLEKKLTEAGKKTRLRKR